jgi:AraC-like DNA-binding protein
VLDSGETRKIEGEGDRWHFHSAMELTFFSQGRGTRFVGDHIGGFEAEDLVLLGAGLPHYWHARGASAGASVQWDFPAGHAFWGFPELNALRPLFERAAHGVQIVGRCAGEVGRALQNLDAHRGACRLGAVIQILGKLAEGARISGELVDLSQNSFQMRDEGGHQRALGDAVRYLLANFRSEVLLADLLEITCMSKSTFSRQFRRHSGKTFQQFLLNLRMEAACRALSETVEPILEIAQRCGFTEVSFFNRIFRRAEGCTPSEYRRRKQHQDASVARSKRADLDDA